MRTGNGDGRVVSSRAPAVKMFLNKQNVILSIVLGLAILHVLVIGLVAHPLLPSNIIQFVAPLLAVILCFDRARSSSEAYFRQLWYKLSVAFLIWATSQGVYLWHVVNASSPPHFPSFTDFLWLLFSFPILLAAAKAQDRTENDWTGILDITQACFSVCLLYAVIFVVPSGFSDSLVYDIQSTALLFACAIRYSTATTVTERAFFRDLTVYVIFYAIITAAGVLAQDYGSPTAGITDLAWSLPTLIFCAIAAGLPEKFSRTAQGLGKKHLQAILPAHIHGIGSLGLALTSMAAGVVMTFHRPSWGIPSLGISCILFALRTAIRESQLKRAQVQLEYESLHDNLTGLANRALLIRELEQSILTTSQKRSLLFLDLDHFKDINDSLGHTFGDRILRHIAKILRSSVRPEDIVARLGGDEFVILMNDGPGNSTAQAVAARILNNLRTPAIIEDRVVHITGSIGIVAVEEGATTTHLLRDADAAMYSAKSTGRNRARIFDQTISDKRTRELDMESDLRRALEEGKITVAYQPIYSLETETLEGFEALARWTHSKRGTIPPKEFIPLAEDTGLILELGKQIIKKACCQIARWNKYHKTNLCLSMNLSGRQLTDKTFLPYLKTVLHDSQLKPSLLKFEVREGVFLNEKDLAQETLSDARSMGIQICLDGFGTGYSSLTSLLQLPIDVLKLDRTMLQDIDDNKQREEMLGLLIQLAKTLKKQVIVQGVETPQQLELLLKLRCSSVQGFLMGRPMPPEVLADLLESELGENAFLHRSADELSIPLPSKSQQPPSPAANHSIRG